MGNAVCVSAKPSRQSHGFEDNFLERRMGPLFPRDRRPKKATREFVRSLQAPIADQLELYSSAREKAMESADNRRALEAEWSACGRLEWEHSESFDEPIVLPRNYDEGSLPEISGTSSQELLLQAYGKVSQVGSSLSRDSDRNVMSPIPEEEDNSPGEGRPVVKERGPRLRDSIAVSTGGVEEADIENVGNLVTEFEHGHAIGTEKRIRGLARPLDEMGISKMDSVKNFSSTAQLFMDNEAQEIDRRARDVDRHRKLPPPTQPQKGLLGVQRPPLAQRSNSSVGATSEIPNAALRQVKPARSQSDVSTDVPVTTTINRAESGPQGAPTARPGMLKPVNIR